jgi:hypothetical protein
MYGREKGNFIGLSLTHGGKNVREIMEEIKY